MKKIIILIALMTLIIVETRSQIVTDFDGNEYDTVVIGTQVWLKQNLKVTHYNDGMPIPNVTADSIWSALTTGARSYYDNDSLAYDSVYGPLYNWYVVASNNICPLGWHVSTNAEWQTLETYLGGIGVAGGELKEAGVEHWSAPNSGASNSTGFTGLPGGVRTNSGVYDFMNENGMWWTSTPYNSTMSWTTYLYYLNAAVDHNPCYFKYGLSVRCVKDNNEGFGDNADPAGKILIYPNPASDVLYYDLAGYNNLSFTIYNVAGNIVMEKDIEEPTGKTDISSLASGIYVIRMKGTNIDVWKKLIVK